MEGGSEGGGSSGKPETVPSRQASSVIGGVTVGSLFAVHALVNRKLSRKAMEADSTKI
jgi:hypothetical protein